MSEILNWGNNSTRKCMALRGLKDSWHTQR